MADKYWLGTTDTSWATATNWSGGTVPVSTDSVIVQGDVDIVGSDQSAVLLAGFTVEAGYTGNIGSLDTPLEIDCDTFDYNSTGRSFIDIGSSAAPCNITRTGNELNGSQALWLKGSAITTIRADAGSIRLWGSTVTELNSQGATVYADADTTITQLNVTRGNFTSDGTITNGDQSGGSVRLEGANATTSYQATGGSAVLNSTGTITTLDAEGSASINLAAILETRTVTTLTIGGSATVNVDLNLVTVTNLNANAQIQIQGKS